MALTEKQQVIETLRKAERPMIVFRKEWNADSVASAVALSLMLKDMGKKPEIVCEEFAPDSRIAFLPGLDAIRPDMAVLRRFVISVDTAASKIGELSYETRDGFLHIYLAPKSGALEPKHVKTSATDYHHDLVICIDTPDLASLGAMAASAADFFYRTPILNLDHSPANEHYGQVNLVEQTTAAVGEVLYGLAKEMNMPLREELATAMLTGIVSKTRSFKTGLLTPQTLRTASELVAAGAKRDMIVASLYRTKTIQTLKLWGRALARMRFEPSLKLVSTVLTRQDFVLAGAEDGGVDDVVDELIVSSPDAETIALFYEKADGTVCCTIRSDIRKDADRLAEPWSGTGSRVQSRCFMKDKTIIDAEREVLEHLRRSLAVPRAA
jgi:phosphoesterase RecJ-like protein